ncbi:protein TsgA, partial [Striga asiatica]
FSIMDSEAKDPSKAMDCKSMAEPMGTGNGGAVKKRVPKKIRQIPDYYLLPRRSMTSAFLFYGSWIAAGIEAGMLIEIWLNKKAKVEFSTSRMCPSNSSLVDICNIT